MNRAVGLLLGVSLSVACQKSPQDPVEPSDSKQPSSKELPPALLGDYVEHWGPNDAGQTQHKLSKEAWVETHKDAAIKLDLISQTPLSSNQWAALFEYTLPSSQERQTLRLDFFKADPQTLWICRHPITQAPDPIKAKAADTADTLGQGCFGAPWRKLYAPSAS